MALKIEIEGRKVTLEQVAAAMAGLHSTKPLPDLKPEYRREIMEAARQVIVKTIAVSDYDVDHNGGTQ